LDVQTRRVLKAISKGDLDKKHNVG
jgi:hypothetical protein